MNTPPNVIKRLRELERKTTGAPWKARILPGQSEVLGPCAKAVVMWPGFDRSEVPRKQHNANACLIATVRNALPSLLDAAEENVRLREEVERLKAANAHWHRRVAFLKSCCLSGETLSEEEESEEADRD